ncbi:hypothetical protein C7N43_36895 [Sphingobacteriales bacterium UPWRP_1]|nr:hypothetical protein B6N25_09480 [Sphingobacteriales bacterium TSM_CSS]PSJ71913.1 hypothetical protein C7N43_36895 [Sphingobacteriales bacterium UPWRP_1]
MAEKKFFVLTENCRLYPSSPSDDNLKHRWHVYYQCAGKRVQKYGRINAYNTVTERLIEAKKLAETIEENLREQKRKAVAKSVFIADLEGAMEQRAKGLRHKSVTTYNSKVKAFVEFLTNKAIVTPHRNDVSAFFASIRDKHPSTYNTYKETLSSLAMQLVKGGKLYENIFSHIEKLKCEKQPKMFFTESQIARLKRVLLQPEYKLLWVACQMQYYTFLRSNELRQLKVGDLILEESQILVRAEIAKNKKREFVVMPKQLSNLLSEWVKHKSDIDFVLTTPNKGQLSRDALYKEFKKVLLSLNMDTKKHSFYSWKHTGARAWVKSGGSMYGLMRQMRHHSLDQTQQYLRKLGILEFEDDVNAMPII